jgi:hypothetical protein
MKIYCGRDAKEALPNIKYRETGKKESLSLMAEGDKGEVLPTYRVTQR